MKNTSLAIAAAVMAFSMIVTGASAEPSPWTGHWTFDGHLLDESGNGQDAYAEAPVFTNGPAGKAVCLGGAGVTVPDAPGLRLARGFRIECRVRFCSLPAGNAWATVAMKGDSVSGEYMLRANPASEGQQFGFFVNTGSWEPRVQSRARVKPGVWYQVAAGWDDEGLWLTVDGDTTRLSRSGLPNASGEPLHLGPCDGELDELRIESRGAARASAASWSFDSHLRDLSGHSLDFASPEATFAPVRGGQALNAGSASLSVTSTPALQLAPGLRLDASFCFNTLPSGITTLVMKDGEYQLRLDPQAEGGRLSFFVNLNGWEPRVRSERRIETGVWYRVSARWDGMALTLDVNGTRTDTLRAGIARAGNSPLTLGRFSGLIDNVRIENPKPPVVKVRDVSTAGTLLRAGRTERLTATVRNFASEVTNGVVTLELPKGVVCESPATLAFGVLPSGASRPVEWRVRADAAQTAAATLRLSVNGLPPSLTRKTLAFLPSADPDFSAKAWNPPAAAPAQAATFYVDSARGDNAHAGTAPDAPWKDFTPVNGRTLGPGERLLIRRGSVINQELSVSAKGTPQAWAEIGAYGEGPRPVIRRDGDIDDRCALIKDPDYLRIRSVVVCHAGKGLIVHYTGGGHRGLLIEDSIAHHIEGLYRMNSHGIPEWRDRRGAPGDSTSSAGFAVSGALAEDLVLRDCEMFQCSWGFRFSGDNVAVDRVFCHDNYAHNTSPHPALTSIRRSYLLNSVFDAPGWHAHAGTMGIMLCDPVGLVIRNCHFLNQPDSGSHDEGGIDFENHGDGCLIDRCTFRNNAGAAIEMLGLKAPQARNVEIANSRFDRNNTARKLGPSEIFIWGSRDPEVCCSTGLIRDNGYALNPGVLFFTNQAPATTRWTLSNNTEFATSKALDKAMPLNHPPAVDAGREIWTDRLSVRLGGKVDDDKKPASGKLSLAWEVLEGPGDVAFRSPAKPGTKAGFSAPGDYLLRLVADDGELWRCAHTAVHILPAGASVARAWAFSKPLDKEGWTDWNLGTKDEAFLGQKWECVSRPVRLVAGGYYVLAMENTSDAHLLSPDALGVSLADNGAVALRFQNHTPATRMRLRFTTEDAPAWEANLGQRFEVTANDRAARLYTVDLRGAAGWRGKLKQLRLDFSDGAPLTGTCRIDYIWIGRAGK